MSRVLLTNDDGVHAAGLRACADAMHAAGHDVIVVAPDGNRSATSHHVTIRERMSLQLISQRERETVWACSGMPADCVRVAVLADWIPEVDIVVSGINHGVNLGEDVYYSGTFAAAVEAGLMGLPAIAASQSAIPGDAGFLSEHPTRFPFGDYLAQAVTAMAGPVWPEGRIINMNFPATLVDPVVRLSTLGARNWRRSSMDAIAVEEGYLIDHAWATDPPAEQAEGSDFAALIAGSATVTPLHVRAGIAVDLDAWPAFVAAGFPLEVGGAAEDGDAA